MTALSLEQAAAADGEREALISGGQALTYRALAARVDQARGWLAAQGIAPAGPEPVALVMYTNLETIELFWAVLALGRSLLVLHPRQRPEVRAALVARTAALEIDSAVFATASRTAAPPKLTRSSSRPRLIVPTSGTRGEPKLVCLSERALIASANANWQNLGVLEDERWLACLPLGHIGGLSILTRSLLARRTAVLFDGEAGLLGRLDELARALEAQRVTLVSLVPTLLDALLERGFRPPPTLRAVLLGGAAPNVSQIERALHCGLPVLTSYGLTEAASQVTTRSYRLRLERPEIRGALVGSGHPLSGTKVRIGPDHEIEIAGPTLFDGYWGEPPPKLADGWFRSGDRGLLDGGELIVLGRGDDLIVTGGENVDPIAVEAVLCRTAGLKAACVFGVPDPRWGQIVAAALAFAPGSEPSLDELHALFASSLASHERPRLVALFAELPLNAGGKIDRERVKETALPRLLILQ